MSPSGGADDVELTLVSEQADVAPSRWRSALPWLREVVVIGVVYLVYSFVRNQFGSAHLRPGDAPRHAFNNAVRIISLEKHLGLFHEQTIQNWFLTRKPDGTLLHASWLITAFNVFYGTAHFIVTLAILVWLFVRHRQRFGKWRTTLMVTTVLALIGFALFPLMPPRLFNAKPATASPGSNCQLVVNASGEATTPVHRYGGGCLAEELGEPNYKFVDTLRDVGGLWSFDSEKLDSVSNQYAAMPSLHIGWSTWCMLVLLRFSKRRITKVLAVLYPFVTLLAIVATANHYIIDAAGGLLILGAGTLIATLVERRSTPRADPSAGVGDTVDDATTTAVPDDDHGAGDASATTIDGPGDGTKPEGEGAAVPAVGELH